MLTVGVTRTVPAGLAGSDYVVRGAYYRDCFPRRGQHEEKPVKRVGEAARSKSVPPLGVRGAETEVKPEAGER